MIEGARRIGKSTVVEAFAKNEYESYILIDFSIASKGVKEVLVEHYAGLNGYTFGSPLRQALGNTFRQLKVLVLHCKQSCKQRRRAIPPQICKIFPLLESAQM